MQLFTWAQGEENGDKILWEIYVAVEELLLFWLSYHHTLNLGYKVRMRAVYISG